MKLQNDPNVKPHAAAIELMNTFELLFPSDFSGCNIHDSVVTALEVMGVFSYSNDSYVFTYHAWQQLGNKDSVFYNELYGYELADTILAKKIAKLYDLGEKNIWLSQNTDDAVLGARLARYAYYFLNRAALLRVGASKSLDDKINAQRRIVRYVKG